MSNTSIIYRFENFTLDEDEGKLFQDEKRIELQWIQFKVLLLLVNNAGNAVTKDRIAEYAWEHPPDDNSITNCISIIRKKLDETDRKRFIETISGNIKGYKFIVPVKQVVKTDPVLFSKEPVAGGQQPNEDFSE